MTKPNSKTVEQEITDLFEAAKEEQYIHSRSKETFDDVAALWFLSDSVRSVLATISSHYVVSAFLLKSLALIYQRMRNDYGLPEFDAKALTDNAARQVFLKAIDKLQGDTTFAAFVKWLEESVLRKCSELDRLVSANDLLSVARLGNLADATNHIAEQYVDRQDGDTWVYDAIFQLADELFHYRDTNKEQQCESNRKL